MCVGYSWCNLLSQLGSCQQLHHAKRRWHRLRGETYTVEAVNQVIVLTLQRGQHKCSLLKVIRALQADMRAPMLTMGVADDAVGSTIYYSSIRINIETSRYWQLGSSEAHRHATGAPSQPTCDSASVCVVKSVNVSENVALEMSVLSMSTLASQKSETLVKLRSQHCPHCVADWLYA